jgi:hypothetical protein
VRGGRRRGCGGGAARRRAEVFPSRGHGGWNGGERAQGSLEGLGQSQPGLRFELAMASRRRYGMGGGAARVAGDDAKSISSAQIWSRRNLPARTRIKLGLSPLGFPGMALALRGRAWAGGGARCGHGSGLGWPDVRAHGVQCVEAVEVLGSCGRNVFARVQNGTEQAGGAALWSSTAARRASAARVRCGTERKGKRRRERALAATAAVAPAETRFPAWHDGRHHQRRRRGGEVGTACARGPRLEGRVNHRGRGGLPHLGGHGPTCRRR